MYFLLLFTIATSILDILFFFIVSKYLNYCDQRFNGELMRVVTGPFICVLGECLIRQIKAILVIGVAEF